MKAITSASVTTTPKGLRIELPGIYRYQRGEYMFGGGTPGQARFSKEELLARIGELLDEVEESEP